MSITATEIVVTEHAYRAERVASGIRAASTRRHAFQIRRGRGLPSAAPARRLRSA